MKNPFLQLAAGVLLVIVTALVCWQIFGQKNSLIDGSEKNGGTMDHLPPRVGDTIRLKESLVPGKTYSTHATGTVNFRGTDKDWGLETVISINYAFDSQIDRTIESNDGKTIVEVRDFREIRCLKFETRLEDVRISLGESNEGLLNALAIFDVVAPGIVQKLQGISLKPVLQGLRLAGIAPEKLLELDKHAKVFTELDPLTGKSIRITYVDGKGVTDLKAVKGEMTRDEENFHRTSVLVSDSLIFPKLDVRIGDQWLVDGRALAGMIDPGLRAFTRGDFTVQREKDKIVENQDCAQLRIVGGRILFDSSTPNEGRIGHFDPTGSCYFAKDSKVIIRASLKGTAVFEKFSKNHLLFEARSRNSPVVELNYTCRVKGN